MNVWDTILLNLQDLNNFICCERGSLEADLYTNRPLDSNISHYNPHVDPQWPGLRRWCSVKTNTNIDQCIAKYIGCNALDCDTSQSVHSFCKPFLPFSVYRDSIIRMFHNPNNVQRAPICTDKRGLGWVEWGFYALSASKAIFRARTYKRGLTV